MGCSLGGESIPPPEKRLQDGGASQRGEFTYRVGSGFGGGQAQVEAKLVLLGDSGVGKSSIALRFCQGRFSPFHEVTIGAAFLQQIVRLRDGKQIKLHIWDTGGQERFRAMAPLYYRDSVGAVIVYDATHPKSFEAVKYWVTELRDKGPPGCIMAIAANKSDLKDKLVDPQEARAFCEAEGMAFVETSAKTGDGVGRLFEQLADNIYTQMTQERTQEVFR